MRSGGDKNMAPIALAIQKLGAGDDLVVDKNDDDVDDDDRMLLEDRIIIFNLDLYPYFDGTTKAKCKN
jgi:hypothetical protein